VDKDVVILTDAGMDKDGAEQPPLPHQLLFTTDAEQQNFPAINQLCRSLVVPQHHRSVLRHTKISTVSEQYYERLVVFTELGHVAH